MRISALGVFERGAVRMLAVAIGVTALLGVSGRAVLADEGQPAIRWVNNAAGLTVRPPGAGCSMPGYTTIQSAVNAAAPGDIIIVCPGTYRGQVTIGSGKDNLTVEGFEETPSKILAPAVMSGAGNLVQIDAAHNVTVTQLTISGPFPDSDFCGSSAAAGVAVVNGASATISNNHITRTEAAYQGVSADMCPQGLGILVGRASAPSSPATAANGRRVIEGPPSGTTGTANILNNRIDHYQQGGIVVDNTGSSATINNNQITGSGPDQNVAQNGIQISDGATATLGSNSARNNIFTGGPFVGTGLLTFSAGRVMVSGISEQSNDVGTFIVGAGAGSLFSYLEPTHSTFEGIDVGGTSGITIDHAYVLSNGGDGIQLFSDATGNTVSNSSAYANVPFDCQDESTGAGTLGTANTWTNDQGTTDSPVGICTANGENAGSGSEGEGSPTFNSRFAPVSSHGQPKPFH